MDVEVGKNLVGAFHPPRLVLADPRLIRTLPRRERAQGLVEAVKHGAIMDSVYLEALERNLPALLDGEAGPLEKAVARSVELKAGVVSSDERESGRREILNFGHTLGHAIEAASRFRIPHGTAVAVGMCLEARLGERLGVTEAGGQRAPRPDGEGPGDRDRGRAWSRARRDHGLSDGRQESPSRPTEIRVIVPNWRGMPHRGFLEPAGGRGLGPGHVDSDVERSMTNGTVGERRHLLERVSWPSSLDTVFIARSPAPPGGERRHGAGSAS